MNPAQTSTSTLRRREDEPPSWTALDERAGAVDVCMPEELPGLSADAQMVATLHSVMAQLLKSPQLFITNGFLSSWSPDLARAHRRLGTPRARKLAEAHIELVEIGKIACAREAELRRRSTRHDDRYPDPVLEGLAARLGRTHGRLWTLDPALRVDVAAHLDGARPRASSRPWPRVPRVTIAMKSAWG